MVSRKDLGLAGGHWHVIMKINVGAINGQKTVSFKVTDGGIVLRAGWRDHDMSIFGVEVMQRLIPAREAFRRWKICRKAWQTRRRAKQQLLLKL